MAAYRGFLGSSGVRFPGQIGTDIHLTDWRQNPALPRIRQLAMALGLPAQTLSFITPEIYVGMAPGPAGGQVELWIPHPGSRRL